MKWSQLLIPTVKETPGDAEIASHQLMIRAGLMRRLASGTYVYLPLGKKMLDRVSKIIREEMDAAGAQEILMPVVQPMELWEQTGRNVAYGETLGKFEDRHGRLNVLTPTAEEVVTWLVAGEVQSYKQLPINLYQINTKFRDEFRPRFGVLRSREFIMKDAYSFHTSVESLNEIYQKMYDAYCRIFKRCGIPFVIVEAESGPIGGSASHEFMVPCSAGEDLLFYTEDGKYAANVEKAEVDPAPKQPAVSAPPMAEVHTPEVGSIEAVCNFLKTQPAEMIKTLIFSTIPQPNQKPAIYVVLLRGDHEVNEAKLRHGAGVDLELASEIQIEETTGAKVGFAGPMGLAAKIQAAGGKMIIDHSVAAMAVGVTGANKTDNHIRNVVPGRDFPLSGENIVVADIRNAVVGDTHGGKPLLSRQGIEVGHVFKLGTKYSEKLGAKYLDENSQSHPCIMGCYGIGVNRIIASAIEVANDENGITWPVSIAPFEVLITTVNQEDQQVAAAADQIYHELRARGVDVLLDDRLFRGGVKFKDADLIGIPVRITIGQKNLKDGKVEIRTRRGDVNETSPIDQVVNRAAGIVKKLYDELNG